VIWELRRKYKITKLLAFAKLPRSSYYYYLRGLKKLDKYEAAKAAIVSNNAVHKGRYGYRRMTVLLRQQGFTLNHKTVQRLMRELNIVCMVRMKKYHSYRGEVGKVAPNLLEQNFHTDLPNKKWVTDVTEFSLFGQKIYLSPILDLCNEELVSYSIGYSPSMYLVTDMLEKAFSKIPDDTGLILHSDQGWQYQMKKYQHELRKKGVRQSMSRKGNCLDNAVVENFFGILKSELLYLQKFNSVEHFVQELVDYMDYYNNHRMKIKLKGLSPVQYRTQVLQSA
jgi:putative transposase